jgi:organic hydroperoxide reductase OsmC/OhrA
MSEYRATVQWQRGDQVFSDNRYSRAHVWSFDGGVSVAASSAPSSVPVPLSDPAAVDPEEALIAATSSCHMLFFLSLAAKAGFVVDLYEDEAYGRMGRDDRGKMAVVEIVLRPRVQWAGEGPGEAQLEALHYRAHEDCYVANSLRAEVRVETF